MNMKHIIPAVALASLLLLGTSGRASFAMGGYTPDQVLTGTVQSIDYLHHTITINGQTYAVSAQAKFTGIGGFSVLHIGMPVECRLSNPPAVDSENDAASSAAAVIIAVTWAPGSA